MIAHLTLAALAVTLAADLSPLELDLDKAGTLEQRGFTYLCKSVIDEQTMVVGGAYREPFAKRASYLPYFVVKGVSTRGFVDNKVIDLKGKFKVTGTTKIAGDDPGTTKTVYVLELQK